LDLKAMVDAHYLEPIGERRARHYVAAALLQAVRKRIREERPPRGNEDPFEDAAAQLRLAL
jgi:hypothetical protein